MTRQFEEQFLILLDAIQLKIKPTKSAFPIQMNLKQGFNLTPFEYF